MSEIARVVVNWTGFNGAPGYTNLHFRDFEMSGLDQAMIDNAVAKTDTWLGAILTVMPGVVKLGINPNIEIIESATGMLTRFMTGAPLAPRAGAGTGAYSGATGACVNWITNGVRNGRRVRGRTFLVPINGNFYDTDGTLANGALTALRNANDNLIAGGSLMDLGVFSRPSAPGAADGTWHVVQGTNTPDKVAVLRSRRG